MKVYIVFTAIFMMAFTCVVYQGDMNLYRHEQETLKMSGEEAACKAALCIDDEAYGEGIKKFDYADAEKAVDTYIEYSRRLLAGGDDYNISFDIVYEDDERGYDIENHEKRPSVHVSVSAECDDFFRLPFLFKNEITRKSKYEIKGL